jgi:Poxvirus Late Transcription Factor VLTF3 like
MSLSGSQSFDLMRHLPLNLSASSMVKKKAPKQRNKKVTETLQCDILQIDAQIKAEFDNENANIPEYERRSISMIRRFTTIIIPFGISQTIQSDVKQMISSIEPDEKTSKQTITYQEFLAFYDQVKRLILKCQNLRTNQLRQTYEKMTGPVLNEYRTILSVPVRSSFLSSKKTRRETDTEKRKKELIETFIRIASDFVINGISYIPEPSKNVECKLSCQCGNATDFETREGSVICENCGLETETTSAQSTFKDIDRINTHTKYRYEKSLHFNEAIAQYQGKQNKYIDDSIYPRIEAWAIKHNLLDLEHKDKRYSKFKKDHLRLMLSESKDKTLTDHHEDVHLIYSKFTGKPCADISHLEAKLKANFDLIEQAFWASPEIDRNNILNGAFVLANLLEMEGYPVNEEDFPGLKTSTRQEDHEALFTYLCQKAGINYTGNTKRRRALARPTTPALIS